MEIIWSPMKVSKYKNENIWNFTIKHYDSELTGILHFFKLSPRFYITCPSLLINDFCIYTGEDLEKMSSISFDEQVEMSKEKAIFMTIKNLKEKKTFFEKVVTSPEGKNLLCWKNDSTSKYSIYNFYILNGNRKINGQISWIKGDSKAQIRFSYLNIKKNIELVSLENLKEETFKLIKDKLSSKLVILNEFEKKFGGINV